MKGPFISNPAMHKAKEIVQRHRQVMITSTMVPYPMVGQEAEGALVKDLDGNIYLDFSSAVAVMNVGYNHPEVKKAVLDQAEKLIHFAGNDYYNAKQVELAEKLVSITPGKFKKKVFFSNSGAESVECAFKLARWHTKKPGMLSFLGAFHGRTFGALSLSACKALHKKHFYPMVPQVIHIPYAYCYRCAYKLEYPSCDLWCAKYLEEVALRFFPSEDLAAVIVEPIQGEAGYVVPPPSFLSKIESTCRKNGLLLVADEVQTGFARTGKMFACEHSAVEPDIITLSKALAAGLPMGATVARAEVANWDEGLHSNTMGGNMLSAAAAIANINVIEREDLCTNARKLGEHAMKRLRELKERSELVGDVRGLGLMIGIEFVKNKHTKERAITETERIAIEAFNNGLILLPVGLNCIRIAPPLNIDVALMDQGIEILEKAVRKVAAG
jgi:4-aminobutyrate aminotransferase